MQATLYLELSDKIDWYVEFCDEKGNVENDLAHAELVLADIHRNPYKEDPETQTRLLVILTEIIEKLRDLLRMEREAHAAYVRRVRKRVDVIDWDTTPKTPASK